MLRNTPRHPRLVERQNCALLLEYLKLNVKPLVVSSCLPQKPSENAWIQFSHYGNPWVKNRENNQLSCTQIGNASTQALNLTTRWIMYVASCLCQSNVTALNNEAAGLSKAHNWYGAGETILWSPSDKKSYSPLCHLLHLEVHVVLHFCALCNYELGHYIVLDTDSYLESITRFEFKE